VVIVVMKSQLKALAPTWVVLSHVKNELLVLAV